jgi:hypothetical protein
MARLLSASLLGLALCVGAAGSALAQDVAPSKDQAGVVHVNAMKSPEMHAYRAIVAGLDMFDDQHALAPQVPELLFAVRTRNGAPVSGDIPTATLSADEFSLPLAVGPDALFKVPRSQQAWDAKAELVLSRKRREVRVWPHVRTPGLADNQRRLGDIRLECRVLVAVAKEEAPFYIVALVNTVLLTGDWCSFMKDKDRTWSVTMPSTLASATLRDGERSLPLKVNGKQFQLALGDASWSNDALIEMAFAEAPATDPATRTAGETPQTGP